MHTQFTDEMKRMRTSLKLSDDKIIIAQNIENDTRNYGHKRFIK